MQISLSFVNFVYSFFSFSFSKTEFLSLCELLRSALVISCEMLECCNFIKGSNAEVTYHLVSRLLEQYVYGKNPTIIESDYMHSEMLIFHNPNRRIQEKSDQSW